MSVIANNATMPSVNACLPSPAYPLPSKIAYKPAPAMSHPSLSHYRSNSNVSMMATPPLLFTPPLSPTEEQLLAFLIPDIDPADLAAYLSSSPPSPVLSNISTLIDSDFANLGLPSSTCSQEETEPIASYPSPVCAAAAATVVAENHKGASIYQTIFAEAPSSPALSACSTSSSISSISSTICDAVIPQARNNNNKRCSTYAFLGEADEEEDRHHHDYSHSSPTVFVMSSRNTSKRLMLEQPFVLPDEDEVTTPVIEAPATNNCYAEIFKGATDSPLIATNLHATTFVNTNF